MRVSSCFKMESQPLPGPGKPSEILSPVQAILKGLQEVPWEVFGAVRR